MAHKVKLYMFTGSGPSITARLMLEHKGIDHKRVHVMVGPHAFGMLGRGFETMTVPALKIDGRRVQGSREISRALDDLVPHPPLFPADEERRRAVAEAERWGEQLHDAVRRLVLCAARREPRAFSSVYRHSNPLMRPAQRISRGFVMRLARAAHRATDRAGEEDLAALPTRLDQVDAWIEEGLLDGAELNAADFQIATSVALLLCFEDLAPVVEGRPVARLARRVAPDLPGQIGAVLPAAWLSALRAGSSGAGAPNEPMGPADMLRAIGYDETRITTLLAQGATPVEYERYG
ncbi:hypothetical protein BH20ACT17_BH20ACT17_05890 [soil metagenome]